jgi:hypothetical protein
VWDGLRSMKEQSYKFVQHFKNSSIIACFTCFCCDSEVIIIFTHPALPLPCDGSLVVSS